MSRQGFPGPVPGGSGGSPVGSHGASQAGGRGGNGHTGRPSLGGGQPAQDRALRAQGRQTVSRLLEAALAEFDERGFQPVRVDDIVRRAQTSHGTFYLYFSNKEDLFKALLRDALHDMQTITDEFPVITRNEAGRAALRRWVHQFCDTYAAHAAVIRVLSQAENVAEEVWGDGLQMLFRLAEAMTLGMTAVSRQQAAASEAERAGRAGGTTPAGGNPRAGETAQAEQAAQADPAAQTELAGHAELTALACLMMLERVNYLLSEGVKLPKDEMVDRITAIMFAAFHAP
ncbi:MAG: TetR/AcrR family transcriptional regulator [Actinobacteria bacterium]|nr:TetR/AcrR family transcriptional regulator [Actinomycetota bacterium]